MMIIEIAFSMTILLFDWNHAKRTDIEYITTRSSQQFEIKQKNLKHSLLNEEAILDRFFAELVKRICLSSLNFN